MAAGLPVVVTDVGDCGRIVREAKNGIVVPPQNPEALATGLANMVKDKDLWKGMSVNGAEFIRKEFSLPAFASDILEQYRSIVITRS